MNRFCSSAVSNTVQRPSFQAIDSTFYAIRSLTSRIRFCVARASQPDQSYWIVSGTLDTMQYASRNRCCSAMNQFCSSAVSITVQRPSFKTIDSTFYVSGASACGMMMRLASHSGAARPCGPVSNLRSVHIAATQEPRTTDATACTHMLLL